MYKENDKNLYFIVATLFFGHFLIDFMLGIWPVYKTIAELDLAVAGAITGVCAVVGEGSQLFFGTFGDRGYYRRLATLGIILVTASTLYAYTQNYFILSFLFLSTYLGSGAFHPSGAGLISRISGSRRGMLIIVYMMGGALGLAFSQLVYTRAFFYLEGKVAILGIIPLLYAIFVLCGSTNLERGTIPSVKKKRIDLRQFVKFFKHRDLRLLYYAQVCNQAMLWAIIFLLPDILTSRGYDTWIRLGGGHMSFVLGFGFIMLPAGIIALRYSAKSVILVATTVGFVSCYTFLLTPILSNQAAMFLLFVVGASIGVVNPISLSLGNSLVPHSPGAISAYLMGVAWCVGESLGPGGSGLLTKLFDTDAAAKSLEILALTYVGIFFSMLAFRGDMPLESEESPEEGLEPVRVRIDE